MPSIEYCTLPTQVEGIIFDCDGVILDSRASNALYYNKVLEACALPPLTKEQESFTYMATVEEALLAIIPPHLQDNLSEICKKNVNYARDIMPHIQLEEGFLDFMALLREKGVRAAVHTNRFDSMPAIIDKFSLHGYFSPIITAADVIPKPHPQGIAVILEKWALPKENVLFIGDSLNDQQAAKAGQVSFVAYGDKALDAAANVATFKELEYILYGDVVSSPV